MIELTYDGNKLSEFGIKVISSNAFNSPTKIVQTFTIPGRNGELTIDRNQFENIDIEYGIVIDKATSNIKKLQEFLMFKKGYKKLVDSSIPGMYRMARITDAIEIEDISILGKVGVLKIVFNCQPQLFYEDGDTFVSKKSKEMVINPSLFTSYPIIRIYGNGSVKIGQYQIDVKPHEDPYVDVDCDLKSCSYGLKRKNEIVTLSNYEYPTLPTGSTTIEYPSTITKVEIKARWWTV